MGHIVVRNHKGGENKKSEKNEHFVIPMMVCIEPAVHD